VAFDGDDAPSRLAAIGEIATEIAHELRNFLQIVSSSAFVARTEVDRGDAAAARQHIVKVERTAHLAHALIDDLLTLARGDKLHTERVVVADVIEASRVDLPAAAHWDDAVAPPGLDVRAHPRLLGRLLHALYENAVLASAPRVPLVTTRVAVEGDRVVIEVSDDGPGVPREIAVQIFEPFVTARHGGSGLGLALAKRIAAAHGATLALMPVPSGAAFRVELPR
jgi:signal transduction histidine kinase